MWGESRCPWVRFNFMGWEEKVVRVRTRGLAGAAWTVRWFHTCKVGDCPGGGGANVRNKAM